MKIHCLIYVFFSSNSTFTLKSSKVFLDFNSKLVFVFLLAFLPCTLIYNGHFITLLFFQRNNSYIKSALNSLCINWWINDNKCHNSHTWVKSMLLPSGGISNGFHRNWGKEKDQSIKSFVSCSFADICFKLFIILLNDK